VAHDEKTSVATCSRCFDGVVSDAERVQRFEDTRKLWFVDESVDVDVDGASRHRPHAVGERATECIRNLGSLECPTQREPE
jgi:hypothetical protein